MIKSNRIEFTSKGVVSLTIKKKVSAIAFALLLAVGIAGCSSSEDNAKDKENDQKQEDKAQKDDKKEQTDSKESGDVAAVVNGEEIPMSRLNEQLDMQKQRMKQSGQELKDEQLTQMKSQILTKLINKELLLQKANEADIKASEDKVEKQFNSYTEKYSEEEFNKLLEQNNLTAKQLKEDIASQLKIQKYIEDNTEEVKVTDEELQTKYDEIKKQNDKLPAFDKVKPQLKQQIQQTKQQEQLTKLIDKIRKDSEIEKKINA